MGTTQRSSSFAYFEQILMGCGVEVFKSHCYILESDHMTFVAKLRLHLKSSASYPDNIQEFIRGVRYALDDASRRSKLLTSCQILQLTNGPTPSNASLVMDFLMVECIQVEVITILFEKMTEFATNNNQPSTTMDLTNLDLILSQLIYVNYFMHADLIFSKMMDLLESATPAAKQHIIKYSANIIDQRHHDEFVKNIFVMMPNNKELLTKVTLTAFGDMRLSKNVFNSITKRMCDYLNDDVEITLLSSFTKFILIYQNDDMDLQNIISQFQQYLTWDFKKYDLQNINTSQCEVFDHIALSLTCSQKLYDIWLKTIQTNIANSNYKSIDILILFIMISINPEKGTYIEHNLRNKIKTEQITINVIEDIIEKYLIILTKYFTVFITFIDNCFKNKNTSVVNFAKHAYELAFGLENIDRKLLIAKLLRCICEKNTKFERFMPADFIDTRTQALQVLTHITKVYPNEIQNSGLQLLIILDRSDDYTIAQYRTIMNLLCAVIYSAPETITDSQVSGSQSLHEHIDMLIRKQLHSNVLSVKKQGIIGIVCVIDHIIWNNEISTEIDDINSNTIYTATDLPEGSAQTAGKLIELIFASTLHHPDLLALFYDELSSIIAHKNKQKDKKFKCNKIFSIWLLDTITQTFESNFVVEELPTILNNILNVQFKYCVNLADECDTDIGINITGCVMNLSTNNNAKSSIQTLSSLFNLLRILTFHQYDGNLECINAVLGFAIILPQFMDQNEYDNDIFTEFDTMTRKKIFDIHFYTINWIREIISGFISQDIVGQRKKVLMRLTDLIRLEEKVRFLLKMQTNDYVPPVCEFSIPSTTNIVFKKPNVKNRSSKKKILNKNADNNCTSTMVVESSETILGTLRTQNAQNSTVGNLNVKVNCAAKAKSNKNIEYSYGPKEIYRQMDPDIMLLLKENVIVQYPLQNDNIGCVLGLLEFKFIIEDLVIKLESLIGVRKFTVDQHIQTIRFPIDFIKDLIQFLPKIIDCFNQLSDYLKSLKDPNNTECNDFYSDEANFVKICFGLCIRLQAALYTWPCFEDKIYEHLLKDSIKTISKASVIDSADAQDDLKNMISNGLENILKYKTLILDIRSAVHLFHFTKSLAKFIPDDEVNKKIVTLCEELLSQKWYGLDGSIEKGAQYNVLLVELLKGLLKNINLTNIMKILMWVNREIKLLNRNNDTLKTFPCFSKLNFPLLYRALCASLLTAINRKIEIGGSSTVQITFWEKGCQILNALLDINKNVLIPRNFSLFLKYAHLFVKVFLQYGIPLIEICLRKNSERVIDLLKKLQHTTRYLHTLCCHSKAIRNTAIVAQIPLLRETIEHFILRVKAALAANKCESVFWMGNLKNKDLHGEEMLSQVSAVSQNDDDDDDEENNIPDDDDDDDEEGVNENTNQQKGVSSDAFERTTTKNNATSSRSLLF